MAQWLELEHLPIRLDARGTWRHGDTPMHPRVAALFARHIVPHYDGHYDVVLGAQRHIIEVEDCAFWVRSIDMQHRHGQLGHVDLMLSDATREPLAPNTLMQSAGHIFYCSIRRHGLRVPARFSAQQYHLLAQHLEPWPETPANADASVHAETPSTRRTTYALALAGHLWPIAPYDPVPRRLPPSDAPTASVGA